MTTSASSHPIVSASRKLLNASADAFKSMTDDELRALQNQCASRGFHFPMGEKFLTAIPVHYCLFCGCEYQADVWGRRK